MFKEAMYSNFILIIGLIIILFIMHLNPLYNREKNRLFQISAVINLVLLIVISIDSLLSASNFEGAWIPRRITSFINFAFAPFLPIVLYLISRKIKPKLWFYLPGLLNFILCFLSIFWNIVFIINTDNSYDRGPLFIFPFSVCLLYLAILIIYTIQYKTKSRHNEALFLIFSVIIFLFCFYLELVFKFKFLTWDAAALCTILYYLLLNANNSGMDALTEVYNRMAYSRSLDKIKDTFKCTIALIDINNFKKINDTFGHSEGDVFLKKFAEIMQNNISFRATFYRIGGDEFAIISRTYNKTELREVIEKISHIMKEEDMYFAYGIAEYDLTHSLEDALYMADSEMYAHKRLTHNLDHTSEL